MSATHRTRFCTLLISLSPALALAQQTVTTASIAGRVADTSGAAIVHASVVATSLATGQAQTTTTDHAGRFSLPFLATGQYSLTVQAPGFATVTRPLRVTVASAFDASFVLAVQGTATSVQVQGTTPVLEQDRSQSAATVGEYEATRLPFSGRNFLDLGLLTPGVSSTNTASVQTFAETSPVVGQGYSVNSQRNFSNSFIVDGLSANDDAAGLAGNSYSLDVIREFQVVTSGGQAEFGRALGGTFNLITRSGTNTLHGTAYGFLRNQRLNAANALSRTTLPLTQAQYGGSLGGPLVHNRTFFFANFEQRRLNTDGVITIAPADAATINARLRAVGYRAPLLTVGTGATTLYPATVHTTQGFARVDHAITPRNQASLRYSTYRLSAINARGVGSLADVSYGTAVNDVNHTVAFSNVATVTPHLFNETRAQFTSDHLDAPPNDGVGPTVTISGVASFGRFSSSPTARENYLAEAVNNVVLEHGSHTGKAGVDVLFNHDTITFPQSLRGSYTFASTAAFLTGTYNAQGFTQSFGTPAVTQGNPNLGFYLQDQWKLARHFTFNLGARYDLQFLRSIQTDTDNITPRVGFAWSPYRDGGTVVRGSYGLFYDRVPLRALANALLSANNTTSVAQAALLSYTFSPGQSGAPVFPAVAVAPPTGALLNFTLMDRHLQNAYAQQASLEVEQQLSTSSSLTVSYQHVRGAHLLASVNGNINPDGSRPNPTYGNAKSYNGVADSTYDGLAVSVVQRPSTWASARLSYTWSRATDDVGEFFFSAPVNNFFVGEDRSRSDDDQRHRLTFNATLNSSTDRAGTLAAHFTHGWRLGGILQYTSRLPFNVVTGTTTRQGTTQRPCAPGYSLSAGGGNNPCTQALPGTLIGRNSGTGFDFFTLNARLSRTFAITERFRLEALAEAFNALNHRNDMIPNATFGTGAYPAVPSRNFGQATAVGDPRSIQLAARVNF